MRAAPWALWACPAIRMVLVPRPEPTSSTRSPGSGAARNATACAARSATTAWDCSTRLHEGTLAASRARQAPGMPSHGSVRRPAAARASAALRSDTHMGTLATYTGAGSRQDWAKASARSSPSSPTRRSKSHAGMPQRCGTDSAMNAWAFSATRRSTALARPAALFARLRTSSTPWLTTTWAGLSRKSSS